MSDIEEYGHKDRGRRGRRGSYGSSEDEGSDGYDTRRAQYSDDEEEDEDEDDNDDELRREGFLVDDDEEEEEEAPEERRRKKKKKKRRHIERIEEEDELDEEDLALVAENTNQEVGTKFKRLKRGRTSRVDEDELRAELDDLMDTGGDRQDRSNDLGLFDDGGVESDISEHDYRASRRMDRGREKEEEEGEEAEDSDGLVDDPLSAPRRRRTGHDSTRDDIDAGAGARHRRDASSREGGEAANYLFDSLESIDDDTWMELQDIFGDGEEYAFAMEAAQAPQDTYREKTLADVFEPAELEAKMMTQMDDDIRTTDIPERIQMRAAGHSEALRALSDDDINEEATWIIGKLHRWQTQMKELRSRHEGGEGDGAELFKQAEFFSERFLAGVLEVLKHMSHDFYEVPYIYRHCRELFVTGSDEEANVREWLTMDDLWSLYDHEQQYRGFLASRRHARNVVRRLSGGGGAGAGAGDGAALSQADAAYVSDFIASANCVEDISDVVEWLQARYGREMRAQAAQAQTQAKRAQGGGAAGPWEQAERDGTARLVERMGISARQVGENIATPGRHAVADSPSDALPLDAARSLAAGFGSAAAALRAGVAAFAAQLAVDPHVRRHVRAYCEAHACVVVRATDRGLREITDSGHPAFAFKFLRQKPAAAFAGSAQFLAIARAADDGLVRVAFSVTGEHRFGALADDAALAADAERSALVVARQIEAHARSYAVHGAAAAWNPVRADAVLQAARAVLALVWHETAQRLRAQAEAFVGDACRRALQARIDVRPPRPGARVVVVAGGGFDASARGALRVVYVDGAGRPREDFSADSVRAGSDGAAQLAALLLRRPADVVAVAGMSLQARRLLDDVRALVAAHCARASADVMVTYARDDAARLWWDCDAARAELPAMRREERYCVAVARALQDAPAAYAALGPDVLRLRLHPAQRLVDAAVLLPAVQRAFVNVVASTGVDVNAAAAHPHLAHTLPFVAGLGPRKAHAVLSRVSPADPLESRNDLVTRRLCTRCVFVNCASFLRIRPPAADALDATRIHPQDYILAYKMAMDALDIEEDDDDGGGGSGEDPGRRGQRAAPRSGPARYVAEVMRNAPDKLDDLDLVGYAEELKRKNLLKLETLKFIKHELQNPDDDPRAPFEPPDSRCVLEMLTGEVVGETLREDGTSLVSAVVVRVQPKFAIARLDSGLEGFISVANVADYRIDAVSDELAPGQSVVAVVKRVDPEKMSLDLSTRQSDIDEALRRSQSTVPESSLVDRYFDFDSEAALREHAKALWLKSSARMRTIPHPLFKPFNSREAEQYLDGRPRGDCVIRPSSRGLDHIAITWKVAEGLFQHIDVQERDKPSEAALGSTFLVGDAAYTDLDELVAFHVDPISRKLEEVKRSPKFYDPETDPLYATQPVATLLGVNDYTDEYRARRQELWETRTARHLDTLAQSTGRGSYCISLSLAKPGSLVLAFKPTPTYAGIMKWTARVEPNEFKLGERGRYPDINGLINGFKRMQTTQKSSARPSSAYEDNRLSSGRSHHGRSYADSGRWERDRSSRSGAWGDSHQSSGQRQPGAASASRWES
ncbi:Transcription elongation factor spt6 [Coemansia sp. RSA 2050]|nr:Transcription elongation factor spt6 [Coemansia sp. RSA 2050]